MGALRTGGVRKFIFAGNEMMVNHRRQKILIVDDAPENIAILDAILRQDYRIHAALDGEKALRIATSKNPPDLVLLDVMMPHMNGYEVCERIKNNPLTITIPVIFVTEKGEIEDEEKGFQVGAVDYITKPVSPPLVRERVKTHLALYDQNRILEETVRKRTTQLRKALETVKAASLDTIHRLSRAAEFKDDDTGDHIQRMSRYAAKIAEKMGLNSKVVESILYAAPMHDIGKIGVPDHILMKPGPLSPDEWEIMKQHTVNGGHILEGAGKGFIALAEIIAMTHHEKWDGSGYPSGLKGRRIPLASRITALADVFDALVSDRPYKKPFPVKKAFDDIWKDRGKHFDPDVVDAFFSARKEILWIKEMFSV